MTDLALHRSTIEAMGLNFERLTQQRDLMIAAIASGSKPLFKVKDTCRFDNTGMLRLDAFKDQLPQGATDADGFVAFVPAAGAASRYSAPLAALIESLDGEDTEQQKQHLRKLDAAGALRWPLPERVARLIEYPALVDQMNAKEKARLSHDLHLPKALFPCVEERMSFLCMKDAEHQAIPALKAQVFITPPGMSEAFEKELGRCHVEYGAARKLATGFLEQGPGLSTLRFNRDGSPVVEEGGKLSLVPAGHGALAELIPQAKGFAPSARSLFIRNIDNVMGTKPDAIDATKRFLATHDLILGRVRAIRAALADAEVEKAAEVAGRLLAPLRGPALSREQDKLLTSAPSAALRQLAELQLRLFHSRFNQATLETMKELYARPVNTLGQVPNTGKDVGGTPCFIETKAGIEKVCIEVPHVSEADKNAYLANADKATHFNPVFAAAEIIDDPGYYARRNREFWLLAEKTYRTRAVVYFETVLYELLGNSRLANCAFVEVPRVVFNPHKALDDATGRTRADWT